MPFPTGIGPAQGAVSVPGIVHQLRPVPHAHPGADGESLPPCLQRAAQRPHKTGMNLRVIVEQDYVRGLSRPNPHIHGMAEAGVPGQGDQRNPGEGLFYQLPTSVRGAVVYYNDVIVRGRDVLGQERFQASPDEFDAIVVRDDDGCLLHGILLGPSAPLLFLLHESAPLIISHFRQEYNPYRPCNPRNRFHGKSLFRIRFVTFP